MENRILTLNEMYAQMEKWDLEMKTIKESLDRLNVNVLSVFADGWDSVKARAAHDKIQAKYNALNELKIHAAYIKSKIDEYAKTVQETDAAAQA